MNTSALLLAFALISSSLAKAEEWDLYTNLRFGFSLDFPGNSTGTHPPGDRSGRKFVSASGKFVMEVEGGLLGAGSLERFWRNSLAHYGEAITYKVRKKDWFVVSGVRNGEEFYNKVYVRDGNWAGFQISYPHAENKLYDPYVVKIAKSFQPFLKGNFERAKK